MIPFKQNRLGFLRPRPHYFEDATRLIHQVFVQSGNGNHIKFDSIRPYEQFGYMSYTDRNLEFPYSLSWYYGNLSWSNPPFLEAKPFARTITMKLINIKGSVDFGGSTSLIMCPFRRMTIEGHDIIFGGISLLPSNNFTSTGVIPANAEISFIGGSPRSNGSPQQPGILYDNFEGDLEIYIDGQLLMKGDN